MSYRQGRFGGSRFGGPKPVESGKEYDVQVTEISRKGDGVARIQGFIVFVKGGRVGQRTRVKITHVGDRFATAETISGGEQRQADQSQSSEQTKEVVTPEVKEEEKPELQDYASSEAEEIKPEEQPPTG
ncbi:MAG: TRAM domain-containing protein [Thermoproteota archaeon]|nr:TRAM domain-containing protein [Thermoproteota archaeon]